MEGVRSRPWARQVAWNAVARERSEWYQRGRALPSPSSEAAFRRRREQGSETPLNED